MTQMDQVKIKTDIIHCTALIYVILVIQNIFETLFRRVVSHQVQLTTHET